MQITRENRLSDRTLLDLLRDTRQALEAVSDTDRDSAARYLSALVTLEIEAEARGLTVAGGPEPTPQPILDRQLLAAIRAGDGALVGKIAGRLTVNAMMEVYDTVSTIRREDRRFLGLAALCVAMETHVFGWTTATRNAEAYMDEREVLPLRLRRIERRWGFLLGVIYASSPKNE